MLSRMISANSLTAFSGGVAPMPAARASEIRPVQFRRSGAESLSGVVKRPVTPPSGDPQPSATLPRGSLLDLAI
jgi:hypothetical protein